MHSWIGSSHVGNHLAEGVSANNSMRLHFWQTKAHAELFSQSIPMKVMPLVFMSISLRSNSSCPQTGQIRGMSPTRYRVVGVTIDLAAALRPAPILPSVFFMGVSFSSRTSEVWHGGEWMSRAKRTRDVTRRCHYRLVLPLHGVGGSGRPRTQVPEDEKVNAALPAAPPSPTPSSTVTALPSDEIATRPL